MDVLNRSGSIWQGTRQMQLQEKEETGRSYIQQEQALLNNLPRIPVQHKEPA